MRIHLSEDANEAVQASASYVTELRGEICVKVIDVFIDVIQYSA